MTRRLKIWLAIALLAVAAAATTVGWLVHHGFSVRDQPLALEAFVARRLRHLVAPRSARASPVSAIGDHSSESRAQLSMYPGV